MVDRNINDKLEPCIAGYRCTCNEYQGGSRKSQRDRRSQDSFNEYSEQRNFLSSMVEIVSVIAFIFLGSIAFWIAVAGVLFQFIKRIYYSDRNVKYVIAGLFIFLFLSITLRLILNKRACSAKICAEQAKLNVKVQNVEPQKPPPPPPEYLKVTIKKKLLRSGKNDPDENKEIKKTLTLTIQNENKKEVFKTSKIFFIPVAAMEMKKPPAILVYLKELILDDY